MVDCQKNAHAVWDAKQRVIWAAKCSYKVIRGEIAVRTRDLPRQMCQGREATIVQGSVSPDRVHMLVSVPPQLAAAELAQCMKGLSSRILQDEHPQLRKALQGPTPLGARIFLRERRRGGRGDSFGGTPKADAPPKESMRQKLRTAAGRAVYKMRKAIVEPAFGQAASAANRRLSVAAQPIGFQPAVVEIRFIRPYPTKVFFE